jgi:IMP dehydrogenase
MKTYLTYDDIQLVPAYSEISSRPNISLKTQLSRNFELKIPIVASPMDTVCDEAMAFALFTLGGAGCIHRFMTAEEQATQIKNLSDRIIRTHEWLGESGELISTISPVVAAIGINPDEDRRRATLLVNSGANVLMIDVAHGHHLKVINMIKFCKDAFPGVDIIAGNIATAQAAIDLQEAGADGLRVGIGGGSLCTTRITTGFGVPNVTCLQQISECATVPIMADGGIRSSGDIAKALAIGANTVMLGSLLAGTDESPGKITKRATGLLYKTYRGSASLDTKVANGQAIRNVEGESTHVPYKGGVTPIIVSLMEGVRSALSYAGASDLTTYAPEYVVVTQAGQFEAKPHLLY